MRLEGKVAIITGGAAGIGRSIASAFAEEGARLVVADIDAAGAEELASELRRNGSEAISIRANVAEVDDTTSMAEAALQHYGSIDVLVNNAAYGARYNVSRSPFYALDLKEWDRMLAVNLRGPFLCIRAVFPAMKANGGGKIINIASVSFFWGAPGNVHYVASKGGIIGLTRVIAREAGEFNINVNCIAPGSTYSEDPADAAARANREESVGKRSLKRLEYPRDIAGTAVFLASADSDFITGQTIVVDGGYIMH